MHTLFSSGTGDVLLFALFIFGGIGLGWGIFRFGFLGLKLPLPRPEEELLSTSLFFHSERLRPSRLGIWSPFMMVMSILSVFLVSAAVIFVLRHRYHGTLERVAELLLPATTLCIVAMMGGIYYGLVRAHADGRLSPEVRRLWDEPSDKLILGAGAASFVLFSAYALATGRLTLPGFALSLFLLPVILAVGRVEGRFFLLFFIQELFKVRNWNLLDGKKVVHQKGIKRASGWLERLMATVAVVMVVVGLVTAPLGFAEFLEYTPGSSKTLFSEYAWVARLNLGILVLVLGLGPLLSLATKPFGFINVWLNQRLYEQIASAWDIRTMNRNIVAWNAVVRMPRPSRREGFGEGIALAGGGILGLIALTLASRIAFTHGALPPGHMMQSVFESLQLLSLVSTVVLFASLIELGFLSMEARTTWCFAAEGRKAGVDLINHSLFGLHWLRMRWQHRGWHSDSPESWALPDILYGINDHPNMVKSEQLKGLKRAIRQVLPPAMRPVAWQQLCAFYYEINRPEEGRKTLFKALKLYPKFPDLWAIAVKVYTDEGNEEAAREAFEKAVKYGRRSPQAYCNYGAWFAQKGDLKRAEEIFSQGLRACPRDGLLLFNRALTYGKQDKVKQAEHWFRRTVKVDPFQVDAWLILADLLRDRGEAGEAERCYRKGIEYGPYNAAAWQGLGEMALRANRLEEAEKAFRKALEYDRTHAVAWNNLAVTLRETDRPDEAVEAFRTALENDPGMLMTWETLAELFITYGMWAEAESTYRGALAHHPDTGLVYRNLALVLRQQGRMEEALVAAERAVELEPGHEAVTSYLEELRQGGGLLEGVEEAEQERPDDDTADGWAALGEAKFAEGRWGEAEQCLKKALELEPGRAQLHAVIGDILNQQGRFADAAGAYGAALEIEPDHMGATINLGLACMQAGSFDEAEAAFVRATEINPRELSPWTYLTYLATQTGNHEAALDYHVQALGHLPKAPELWYSYGYLLAQLQRWKASEDAFREGLAVAPDHVQMRVNLGDILFHMERPEEAIAAFTEAAERDPDNVGAWLKKATVQMKIGDLAGSDASYARALEIHPGWTEALYHRTMINAVLGNIDEAFRQAELTLESNPEMLAKLGVTPELEPLKTDPRWATLGSPGESPT